MNPSTPKDAGNLISDRGPAQPSNFADEGREGPNSLDDQHPADPESLAQQERLKNTVPKPSDDAGSKGH